VGCSEKVQKFADVMGWSLSWPGAQRAKIAKKVHKPPLGVNVINFELNMFNAFIWVPWPERIYNFHYGHGVPQCLPLSVVQLKGKHCRKPHCYNGVVDTFEPGVSQTPRSFNALQEVFKSIYMRCGNPYQSQSH
jgi:hypothetical protein